MKTKAPAVELKPVRLSPDCAYVVQLQTPQALAPNTLSGRVEHIATGQANQFNSLEQLYAFMGQTLKPPRRRKGDRA